MTSDTTNHDLALAFSVALTDTLLGETPDCRFRILYDGALALFETHAQKLAEQNNRCWMVQRLFRQCQN